LISLAMDALDDIGEKQPWKHVIVVRENTESLNKYGAQDTVLVFRKPISRDDISTARDLVARHGDMQALYMPGDKPSNAFGRLLLSPDPEQFWRDYPYDVSPVDDDRPFFFYTAQPRDLGRFLVPRDAMDAKVNRAVPLLFGLLAVSLMGTLVVLALPPLLLGSKLPAEPGVRGHLWYFVCIGMGYILIEVALIQKFVLFLGHPTYALTVIVFSMLLSSGIGSFFSGRFLADAASGRLKWVLLGIAVGVSILAFVAAPISEAGVGLPLPLKCLIAICLVAPVGFLMGMPFPAGLRRFQERFPRSVRWAWSLNGASSVLGSAGAIFCAIFLGLRVTLLAGGLLYLGALAVVWLKRKGVSAPPV
jgi:hypothetical protein